MITPRIQLVSLSTNIGNIRLEIVGWLFGFFTLKSLNPFHFRINGIPYFSVVFKQIDKLISDEALMFLNEYEYPDAAYTRLLFSIYLELKDLASFHRNLPSGGDHKLMLVRCHEWFEPSVSSWLTVCKGKALQRVSTLRKICKFFLWFNYSNLLWSIYSKNYFQGAHSC